MATTPKTTKASKASIKDLIQAPAIFRATSKTGAFLGYGVPSDSQPGVVYQVTWNEAAKTWACNCPATKPCKHIKAVCEVCRERKALGKTEFCPCDTAKAAVAANVETPVAATASNEIAAIFVSAAHTQPTPTTKSDDDAQWVEMPNGTHRLASQVDNAYLNELDAQRLRFAERERREAAPLNGNRGFSMLRR